MKENSSVFVLKLRSIVTLLVLVNCVFSLTIRDNNSNSDEYSHYIQNIGILENFSGVLYTPYDETGCSSINTLTKYPNTSFILFVIKGNCSVMDIITYAEDINAVGLIISNNLPQIPLNLTSDSMARRSITIPVVTITKNVYDSIKTKSSPIYAEVDEDNEEDKQKITYAPFLVLGICVICTFLFLVIIYYSYNYGIDYIKTQLRKRSIHLDKTKYAREESTYKQDVCAICLEQFENDSSLSILPCKHLYHHKCINEWIEQSHFNCPVCKTTLFNQDAEENV